MAFETSTVKRDYFQFSLQPITCSGTPKTLFHRSFDTLIVRLISCTCWMIAKMTGRDVRGERKQVRDVFWGLQTSCTPAGTCRIDFIIWRSPTRACGHWWL